MNHHPVGIFDSGLGGLSVWREVKKLLPRESLIYYADSGNCPYGNRPEEEIIRLAENVTRFLLEKDCKMIVVACNTATAAAISYLREHYEVPFVGMEPALKPAAQLSKTGHIGVLATKGTFAGQHFQQTKERFAHHVEVHIQVGTGLVELVETDNTGSPEAEALVEKYLRPMLEQGADQIVLGCSHYPFLLPVMRRIAGKEVNIIDPAPAVARQVERRLISNGIQAPQNHIPHYEFHSSGDQIQLINFAASLFPE